MAQSVRMTQRALRLGNLSTPSFRGDATHRTRNFEIPGLVLTHHPGMTECPHGISYTTTLSVMPRNAASFWIGLIDSLARISATAGESITGPVMWISCEVDRLCTREAIFTVWPK